MIVRYANYFINSKNRKIAPEIPRATRKPFQKSVRKSLFILFVITTNPIIHCYIFIQLKNINYLDTNLECGGEDLVIIYLMTGFSLASNLRASRSLCKFTNE